MIFNVYEVPEGEPVPSQNTPNPAYTATLQQLPGDPKWYLHLNSYDENGNIKILAAGLDYNPTEK